MFGQSQKQKINSKKCLRLLWFHQWNTFRIWWETFCFLIISLAIQLVFYHLPDHWHYLAFSFHSQTSDSCNGSYQGVDLQCVTPSFVIRISPCPSPSPPPPLSLILSFSFSQTLLSACDPLLITMSFICGLPAQRDLRIDQMPGGWWALNRVLFQIPQGQRGGRTRRRGHGVHGKHNSSSSPDPRSH